MVIKNIPLGDQLAAELRRDILSGVRSAGNLLIEKSLSEEFGVSRGPVRDALEQLRLDGLIEAVGRSFRIVEVTGEDITEIYDVRLALEQLAIERSLTREADWSLAHRAIDEMKRAATLGDQTLFAAADLAFHRSLYESTGQRRILNTWATLERTLAVLLEVNPHPDDDLVAAAEEHSRILASIEAGTDDWRDLLHRHLAGAAARIRGAYPAG